MSVRMVEITAVLREAHLDYCQRALNNHFSREVVRKTKTELGSWWLSEGLEHELGNPLILDLRHHQPYIEPPERVLRLVMYMLSQYHVSRFAEVSVMILGQTSALSAIGHQLEVVFYLCWPQQPVCICVLKNLLVCFWSPPPLLPRLGRSSQAASLRQLRRPGNRVASVRIHLSLFPSRSPPRSFSSESSRLAHFSFVLLLVSCIPTFFCFDACRSPFQADFITRAHQCSSLAKFESPSLAVAEASSPLVSTFATPVVPARMRPAPLRRPCQTPSHPDTWPATRPNAPELKVSISSAPTPLSPPKAGQVQGRPLSLANSASTFG